MCLRFLGWATSIDECSCGEHGGRQVGPREEEEEEEEEGLFKANAVNEEDSERDRATPA